MSKREKILKLTEYVNKCEQNYREVENIVVSRRNKYIVEALNTSEIDRDKLQEMLSYEYYDNQFWYNIPNNTVSLQIVSENRHQRTENIEYEKTMEPTNSTIDEVYKDLYNRAMTFARKEIVEEIAKKRVEKLFSDELVQTKW